MWWLVVFLLVDGNWVAGANTQLWHPRSYETRAICLERRAFAEKALAKLEKGGKAQWFCSKTRDAALDDLKAKSGE